LLQPIYIDIVTANSGVIANNAALGNVSGGSLMTLTLRDFANNPVGGANVVIDFTNACDVNLSVQQVNGVTSAVPVGTHTVSGTSDAFGVFSFRLAGAARGGVTGTNYLPAGSGTTTTAEVEIRVNNNLVANATPVCWDQNEAAAGTPTGVNGGDIGFILTSIAASGVANVRRSDLNHSGSVNGADIGFELSRFGSAVGLDPVGPSAAACPSGN